MPDPREKRRRSGRVEGDFWYYTILHNLISVILFFTIVAWLGLFDRRTEVLSEIFVYSFFELVGIVFFLSFVLGLVSRGLAYLILYQIIVILKGKELKKIGDLNRGINKLSISWMISLLLGSILFSVGALIIIEVLVFGGESFIALILSYLLMKGVVFALVRLFSNFKL